jgi:hypothetical protein
MGKPYFIFFFRISAGKRVDIPKRSNKNLEIGNDKKKPI